MVNFITKLVDQPFLKIALILGVALLAFPSVTIDKDYNWVAHPPKTYWPVVVGIALVFLSLAAFIYNYFRNTTTKVSNGIDLNSVKEKNGEFWTTVNNCEIRVIYGKIEDQRPPTGSAIVLPCNEYFDDECVFDPRSALGAYVARVFDGQVEEFISLSKKECNRKFGKGKECRKTEDIFAESFGVGRCLLLIEPLGRSVPVALLSTTTQRVGEGLKGRISYLFDGIRGMVKLLADERINSIVMPLLGTGHGGISPPLAFVGLLLAVADVAHHSQNDGRFKKVTVIVFREDVSSSPTINKKIVRQALALIGSK